MILCSSSFSSKILASLVNRVFLLFPTISFMRIMNITVCTSCESKLALIIEEPRYNGYRGICLLCGGNWPES